MKKKKETLNDRITIRFKKEEKERLIKKAKSENLTPREFIMKSLNNAEAHDNTILNNALISCKVQNILNSLHFTVDPINGVQVADIANTEIEKECNDLWNHLYGKG